MRSIINLMKPGAKVRSAPRRAIFFKLHLATSFGQPRRKFTCAACVTRKLFPNDIRPIYAAPRQSGSNKKLTRDTRVGLIDERFTRRRERCWD